MRARALLLTAVAVLAGCGEPSPVAAPPTPGTTAPPATTPEPAACPAGVARDTQGDAVIDWVDFVQLGGRMYDMATPSNLDPMDLGPVVGVVCFTLEGAVSNPDYQVVDGDAAFLPAGTEIHALGDADPPLRVAVAGPASSVTVYEASAVQGAAVGSEAIDLTAPIVQVRWSDLVSGEQVAVADAVDEPEVLGAMIAALAQAPVDPEFDPNSLPSDSGYLIELVRADGTVTRRVSWITDGGLTIEPGIVLGHAWDDVLAGDRSVMITGVHERFAFYDPCGTSTIEVAGTTWYQMYSDEEIEQERRTYPQPPTAPPSTVPLATVPPATAVVQGFARVAPPGPGDDVGTLVTYSDGTARFEADSGLVEWFTTDERTYDWVC